MKREPTFLMGCGSCDNTIGILHAGYVQTGPGCDNCAPLLAEKIADGDGRLADEMGWCGCGDHWVFDPLMLAYLTSGEEGSIGLGRIAEGDTTTKLLAYIADSLEWTEHGGSVYAAWLTADGRTAAENLRAAVAMQDA